MRSFTGVLSVAVMAGVAHAAEVGYYSQPTVHGDRLIFVSEGDLWGTTIPGEASATGPITAYRLTSSDGQESRPVISPDGQWVAFAGQYDGNTDVYIMAADGGIPKRLTFHPGADLPLAWTSDSQNVYFRSSRAHPLGRPELHRVSIYGLLPTRFQFGECSMFSGSTTGSRFAFTRWSNETWSWKRYRGGTAPEIYVGDFNIGEFKPLTDDPANDLFPMWLRGRVYFLSDRTGTANIFSVHPNGGRLEQHTSFAPDPARPAWREGYDVRWPSSDSTRRGSRIAFCQGGGLAVLDAATGEVRHLDVRIASDRVARRQRFADPMKTVSEFALSASGDRLLVGARGELLCVDVDTSAARQLTRSSAAREWGASFLRDDQVALITDIGDEQQLAAVPPDGSETPALMTEGLEAWLFPPAGSPDGAWVAFADKTMRLHVLDMSTLQRRQVAQGSAGEITDYRWSPDSAWVAYTVPMPNGMSQVHLYSVRTNMSFPVGDGLTRDHEPRWDPAGRYLYMLSDRHLNPVMGDFDFEHVYTQTTCVVAIPLTERTPPPVPRLAEAAGFDLKGWAKRPDPNAPPVPPGPQPDALPIDTDGIAGRHHVLAIEPGNYGHLEAVHGGVLYTRRPVAGLLDESFPSPPLGVPNGTLLRYDLVEEKQTKVADRIATWAMSADGTTVAWPADGEFTVRGLAEGAEPKTVKVSAARLRTDIESEWTQIFDEAWRLQRDFYWADNLGGVDWSAMKVKYEALLPRIGTRAELNDLIGELIGELGTSHTYIWGGDPRDREPPVPVGLLGADIEWDGEAHRIARIIPGQPWGDTYASPLARPHLGVEEGTVIKAINGIALEPGANVYDVLQDEAGEPVRIDVADTPTGDNRRTIEITTLTAEAERRIRYVDWVQRNRRKVDEASGGVIGYVHVPDMGGEGLMMFSRLFYPQFDKQALVIDIRNNGGGFVSQMVLERLSRKLIAFSAPRHGSIQRYPYRAPSAHMAVIIDQHAGSDGDIFPAAFKSLGLGPLIGTRTWGGVVGIRADKPFVDAGISTQPEFAWWDDRGWSIENEGVSPDIEVDLRPEDRLAGRDPQLDRAIRHLLEQLKSDPKDLPEVPPYPVKTP